MSNTYSITCSAMDEHDIALIKSLIGIVGKSQNVEWIYSDTADADVVIIDTDASGSVSGQSVRKAKVVVAYATPDKTLIPNTFALTKPARARELMQVLGGIQSRLGTVSSVE